MLDGKLVNPLTAGEWQVTSLKLVDEKKKIIYFTARKENSATIDLYSVRYDGKNLKRLTFGDYTHQVSVSPDGQYFITNYSRSEEHTSELQSRENLVCRLLLEKKKIKKIIRIK